MEEGSHIGISRFFLGIRAPTHASRRPVLVGLAVVRNVKMEVSCRGRRKGTEAVRAAVRASPEKEVEQEVCSCRGDGVRCVFP